MKIFSESRIIFRDGLSTNARANAEKFPQEAVETQQQSIASVSFHDKEIFDFLKEQGKKGDTTENKWEDFSLSKNPAEIYKILFEGAGAKLKDNVPTKHIGSIEIYFFGKNAADDAERGLRVIQLRDAFLNSERKERSVAELRFNTDVQKYLDGLSNSKAWLKNPFRWFNPDKKSGETVDQRIGKVYSALFGTDSPLARQAKGKSFEENVFGSRAANVDAKRARLEVWQDHLTNRQAQKLKTVEALDQMKKGGVLAESKKFFENIVDDFSGAEGIDKVVSLVSALLAVRALWVDYKMMTNPEYRAKKSTLGVLLDNIGGLVGTTYLVGKGTHNRVDLLDKLLLTSNLDEVEATGWKGVLKELNLKNEPDVRAMLMIGEADLGKTFETYIDKRNETDPKKQTISIHELTNGEEKATRTVTDRDAFIVAHTVFENYGKRYFKFATGREPTSASEEMMGARLFVEYHSFSGAGPSLVSALFREENTARDPKEFRTYFANKEGLLARFVETASAIIQAPIHPVLAVEYLGKNIQHFAEKIGINLNWFNQHVDGELQKKLEKLYENNRPKAEEYLKNIKDFSSEQWGKLMENPESYITDVSAKGVTATIALAGATLEGIYNIGAGMTRVTLNVGGEVYKNIKTDVLTEGTTANKIIFTKWMPYEYTEVEGENGEMKGEWEKASISEGLGVPEMYATAEKFWENYFKKTLPKQWKDNIKPMLDRSGITCGYELFVDFTKAVIKEGIIPAGKATGEGIAEFFTDENNIILAFARAAKDKGVETWGDFKKLNVSVVAFLTEYAEEVKNKEANIKEFEAIISNPAVEEKKYFDGAIDKKKLEVLEPKVRAWMFEQLGWLHLDINSKANPDFDAQTGLGFIEYEDITLESFGTLGSLPFIGNKKCKLKINFSVNGLSKNEPRFEIELEDETILKLNPDQISKFQKIEKQSQVEKNKKRFEKMRNALGDTGSGEFTMASAKFKNITDLPADYDWISPFEYKYEYKLSSGEKLKIKIDIPSDGEYTLITPPQKIVGSLVAVVTGADGVEFEFTDKVGLEREVNSTLDILTSDLDRAELVDPPTSINRNSEGILTVSETPLNTRSVMFTNGAKIEHVRVVYIESGKNIVLSEASDRYIHVAIDKNEGKLKYHVGARVEPRDYKIQINFEANSKKKCILWDVKVQ